MGQSRCHSATTTTMRRTSASAAAVVLLLAVAFVTSATGASTGNTEQLQEDRDSNLAAETERELNSEYDIESYEEDDIDEEDPGGDEEILSERHILGQHKDCTCGLANTKRIIGSTGGNVDKAQKYPWTVLVKRVYHHIFRKQCTGSIIGDRWVLTAAARLTLKVKCPLGVNCMFPFPSRQCFRPKKSKKTYMEVTVGEHKIHVKGHDDPHLIFDKIKVEKPYIHPKFDSCRDKHYDIALLKLEKTLTFTDYLMPICLPNPSSVTLGCQYGTFAGWGRHDHYYYNAAATLNEFRTKILDEPLCGLWNMEGDMSRSQLCAGGAVEGEGICHGDNGGPLMVVEGGRHVLVGIASHVYEDCGKKYWPDIYMRVTEAMPWLIEMNPEGEGHSCTPYPAVLISMPESLNQCHGSSR